MDSLPSQLRRGMCALQLTLTRDRSANVGRWLTELAELAGLTMIDLSCENPGNSQLPENRDICVIANRREFEGCPKTATRLSYPGRGANTGNRGNPTD